MCALHCPDGYPPPLLPLASHFIEREYDVCIWCLFRETEVAEPESEAVEEEKSAEDEMTEEPASYEDSLEDESKPQVYDQHLIFKQLQSLYIPVLCIYSEKVCYLCHMFQCIDYYCG